MRFLYPNFRFTNLVLHLFLLNSATAQVNLVVNNSFERFNNCPVFISEVAMSGEPETSLLDWTAPTKGTTDFFHGCSNQAASVPKNFSGYQPALDGEGYAGLFALCTMDTFNNLQVYREYLLGKLKTPLKAGVRYCVSFYASPTDLNGNYPTKQSYAIRFLGAYISANPSSLSGANAHDRNLTHQPQIESATFMDDTTRWYRISGVYTAQGGEAWITIGNFRNDLGSKPFKLLRLAPPDQQDVHFISYYYIDQVSVYEIDRVQVLPSDQAICADDLPYTMQITAPLENNLWNTGDTSLTKTITEGGTFSIQANLEGCPVRDTVTFVLLPDPVLNLGPDISNCLDGVLQTVELSNPDTLENYRWSTGAVTPTIAVDQPGAYWLKTIHYCGVFTDTIHLNGCAPEIYVPNVFKPAAVGDNGLFKVYGSNVMLDRLMVFNAWGVRVFDSPVPASGWDGRYNGEECMPGVYVWVLQYRTSAGESVQYRYGDVTLVR